MKYSKTKTINDVKNAMKGGVENLYKERLVEWTGLTNDSTPELYTEIIANELINNGYVAKLKGLKPINRALYNSHNHRKITINIDSNRKEENVAKVLYALFNEKTGRILGELGTIFDYQVPLKRVKGDKAGKIDLVSYDSGSQKIWLIELKEEGNKETLLRCILEVATYYQVLDRSQFVKDYDILNNDHADANWVHKAVLVFENSHLSNDLKDMKKGKRPKLQALSDLLGVEFFVLGMRDQVIRTKGAYPHMIKSLGAILKSDMNDEDKKRLIYQVLNNILGDYNFIPSDTLDECRHKLVVFGMPPFYNGQSRDSFCMREMCAQLEKCPITDDIYIFTDEWHDWIPMEFKHCIENAISAGKSIKYYFWDSKRFIQKLLVF